MLFEVDEDDFGGGAHAEGRSPGAGAAGGVDEKVAETAEAVGIRAENTRSEPGEGENLASMGVAGKLEGDAVLLRNRKTVRNVGKQNAGARGIQMSAGENGMKALGVGGVMIGDAEDLESVEIHGFVVEDVDAGIADGLEVTGMVGEFVVIAGDEIGAEFGSELLPGSDEAIGVDVGAVKEIAGDEDDIGAKLAQGVDDAGEEVATLDVTEMRVGDEGGDATAPRGGESGELYGDALDAEGGGVDEAVERGEERQAEEEEADLRLREGKIEGDSGSDGDPGEAGGGDGKVHEPEPDAGDAIEGADGGIEVTVGEERGGDEADGERGEGELESGEPGFARRAEQSDGGFIEEKVDEEKERLNNSDGDGDSRTHTH